MCSSAYKDHYYWLINIKEVNLNAINFLSHLYLLRCQVLCVHVCLFFYSSKFAYIELVASELHVDLLLEWFDLSSVFLSSNDRQNFFGFCADREKVLMIKSNVSFSVCFCLFILFACLFDSNLPWF